MRFCSTDLETVIDPACVVNHPLSIYMAHVTIDQGAAAWAVSGPVIELSIFCVCEQEVIVILNWCKAKCPAAAACDYFSK